MNINIPDDLYSYEGIRKRIPYAMDYAWAIPNEQAIKKIARYSPILEIGAGSGYWASLVEKAHGSIVATDPNIGYDFNQKHTHVHKMTATDAMRNFKRRNVLMVWPSMDRFATYVALALPVGFTLIYVGEDRGGCTADDSFFDVLKEKFKEIEEVSIPQWMGIHDYMWIYKKVNE